MRIKNVSKKVIGNQDFRLLPGESMDVKGDELWVQMYLAEGKLTEVAKPQQKTTEEQPTAGDSEEGDEEPPKEQDETGGISEEADVVAVGDAENRKKGGRKKTEAAE